MRSTNLFKTKVRRSYTYIHIHTFRDYLDLYYLFIQFVISLEVTFKGAIHEY